MERPVATVDRVSIACDPGALLVVHHQVEAPGRHPEEWVLAVVRGPVRLEQNRVAAVQKRPRTPVAGGGEQPDRLKASVAVSCGGGSDGRSLSETEQASIWGGTTHLR